MQKESKAIRLDKKRKRRKMFAGFKNLVQLALLLAMIATTFLAATYTLDNIARTDAELALTQVQIEAAEVRRREIEDSDAYMQSPQFVENIARNWLNLVRRDEIIFIMTTE